ncbi:hypothetical protein ACERII_25415, partial [Evansella sp. AB-rgal1]|uniref:hypothetical protein n=1 Tax=Evansella sp. AB-rgal1 TaxID=3242696 RepID=UPI00359DD26F
DKVILNRGWLFYWFFSLLMKERYLYINKVRTEDQEDQKGRGNKGERLGMGYAHENRTSAGNEEIRRSS